MCMAAGGGKDGGGKDGSASRALANGAKLAAEARRQPEEAAPGVDGRELAVGLATLADALMMASTDKGGGGGGGREGGGRGEGRPDRPERERAERERTLAERSCRSLLDKVKGPNPL